MSENYDLGTARARIAFTADERNLRHAAQAFRNFERTLEGFKHGVERLERSVNDLESEISGLRQEIRSADREFSRTSKSVQTFSGHTKKSHSIVKAFNTDISVMTARLALAHRMWRQFNRPLILSGRFLRDLNRGEDSILGIGRAFRTSGLAAAVLSLGLRRAKDHLLGVNEAMASIKGWRRGFLRLSGPILTGVAAFKLFDKVTKGALVASLHLIPGVTNKLQKMSDAWGVNYRGVQNFAKGIDLSTRGLTKAIIGAAIAKTAFTNLLKPLMLLRKLDTEWIIGIVGGIGLLAPTLELVGKTLTWFSNILLGVLDAAKQLSGGLLLLPGMFAGLLTVIGTVAVGMFGVADAFKAAFEATDEDFNKALEKLPTNQLKDIAKAVRGVKDEWVGLQTSTGQRMFQGFDRDIKTITKTYIPLLHRGMGTVAQAINQGKNELVDFATQQSTVDDIGRSFQLVAEVVRNLNRAIKPAAQGMLDIIIVGQQALADLSVYADDVAESFAEWAKVNRENGNMRKWIDDAVSGVIDLWRAVKNLTPALWTILTLFADRSGDNALERFANSMEKFNNTVKESAASGFLSDLRRGIQGLGTDKLEQLRDLFTADNTISFNPLHHFGPQTGILNLLKDLIPVFRDFAEGFSGTFIPTLKTAMGILQQFANILDALGLDSIVGTLLGFAAGWKLIDKAMGPVIKTGAILVGMFSTFRGLGNIMRGFASITVGALNSIGMTGAGRALNNLYGVLGKIVKVGGGVAAAFFVIKQAIDGTNDMINANKDRLADHQRTLVEWKDNLENAFLADKGVRGETILDQLETGVADFRNKIKADAEESVSWLEHIKGFFLSAGGGTDLFVEGGRADNGSRFWWFSDPQYINDIQNAKREAEATQKALDDLGLSNEDLAAKLAASDGAFNGWINSLKQSGKITDQAANELTNLRNSLKEVENAFANLGPGGAEIAGGIKEIASAGDDAVQKLRGLETILKGLGLLQTDAWQASVAHANAVRELANAADQLVVAEEPLGSSVLFNGDRLNPFSVNAQNLGNTLSDAAANLRQIATDGGDVEQAYRDIAATFPSLIQAFKLDPADLPKIEDIFKNYFGGNLEKIKAGLNVSLDPNLDPEDTDQLLDKVRSLLENKPVPVPIKPETDSGAKDITDLLIPGGKPVEVPVAPKPVAPAAQPEIPLPAVNTNASNLPEVAEQAQQVKQQVEATVDALAAKIQEMANIWNSATNSVTEQTKLIANTLKQSVTDAGNSGMALAKAFAAGISSQTAFVAQAAMGLAQAASAPLPQSPAKIGPFSGRGYTIWRGRKLSEDFAAGIAAGGSAVAGATLGMVGGSSTTLNEGIEKFIKDLTDLSGFGKSILSIIDSISQIVFDTINLVTTDWATGESKLGKVFKKTVSDEELAIKRADRFQASIGNAADFSADFARFTKNLDADDLKNLPRGGAAGSEAGLQPAALFTRRLISNLFPQIQEIGGVRADAMQWHPSGRGLDIIIPGGDTRGGRNPQGKRIGDQIAALANANKEALGLNHVLWQTMQGGNHFDHVHLGFNEGARVDIENIKGLGSSISSLIKEAETTVPGDATVEATKELKESIDENNDLTASDLEDVTNKETLDAIIDLGRTMNATPDEISGAIAAAVAGTSEDIDRAPLEMAREFLGNISQISRDLPINERAVRAFPGEVPSGFLSDLVDSSRLLNDQMATNNQHLGNIDGNTLSNMKSSEDLLNDYLADNPQLDNLIEQTKKGGANDETNLKAVYALEDAIRNTPTDTAQNRALREQLGSIQSSIMEEGGITETPNAVDQAQQIAQGAVGIAGDVFRIVDQSIKSIEAAHDISNTLVRGIENTKDISETVDNVQEFIKLGADIAQAVSSVSGTIGSIVSAASSSDPSGGASGAATAIQGVSQIAGIVSAALNTVNGVIDLVQEGSRIAGKYVGRFLTSISGLSGVSGDIKYLLDTNTGILKAYSSENPLDKQERRGYNMFPNQNPQAPRINYLTIYGGPGQDPRDTMNDAMWAINTTGAGVFSDV